MAQITNLDIIRDLPLERLASFLGYETEIPPWCSAEICESQCAQCAAAWLSEEYDQEFWDEVGCADADRTD